MIWDDVGFLLSKNRYNENSVIIEIYTKDHGKVSGIIFGGTSKKIKNYLQIGNNLHVNYKSKSDSRLGYFKIEIQQALTPYYFDNPKKLSCISSAMHLIRLLTAESQKNQIIFDLINDFFDLLKDDRWIKKYIFWELELFKTIGYDLEFKDLVEKKFIGDQMQLSSPISAVHPGESGKSFPEFLLEDNDTISSDKGIFIDKSRRLHPKLREFISENFYDGRLKNFDDTKKRKIIFSDSKELIPETGIVMVDANHKEICRQKSEEEGKLVKNYYKKLIGSTFLNEKNVEKKMNEEDILVVAPYNVQVNYLKSILPKGARVGTIDKFQGQQAPVTIISMTTSDSDSLPRNVDFFFSRNRLNVGLSRSQCLSIVIMNKKILEINCKKIDHIHLVNTFMKLLNFEVKNKKGN